MKTYIVPVVWCCYGNLEIEAESLDEAVMQAEYADLPPYEDWNYLDGSWEIDHESVEFFNSDEYKG
jgi:hypothetical protein